MNTIGAFTSPVRVMPEASSASELPQDANAEDGGAEGGQFGSLLSTLAQDGTPAGGVGSLLNGTTAGSARSLLKGMTAGSAGSTTTAPLASPGRPGRSTTPDANDTAESAQATDASPADALTALLEGSASGAPGAAPGGMPATAAAQTPGQPAAVTPATADWLRQLQAATAASQTATTAGQQQSSAATPLAAGATAAPEFATPETSTVTELLRRAASLARGSRPSAATDPTPDAATAAAVMAASAAAAAPVAAADLRQNSGGAPGDGGRSATPAPHATAGTAGVAHTRGAQDTVDDAATADPSVAPATVAPKLAVVAQATHFAPVSPLSPGQQIASAITTTLGAPASGVAQGEGSDAGPGAGAGAAPAPAAAQPAMPVLRTLDLQLEPDGLGSVSVSMRLAGPALSMQLDASSAATSRLIERDKDNLVSALQGSGYSVDSVVVRDGAEMTGQGGADAGLTAQQDSGANANSAAPGYSQEGGRNGHDRSSTPQDQAPAASAPVSVSSGGSAPGGDLYV